MARNLYSVLIMVNYLDKIMNKSHYLNIYFPLAPEESGDTTDRVLSDSRKPLYRIRRARYSEAI